jgi:dihydrofolate reductase
MGREMAKLFVQMCVSLDGFVEGRDGEMDWFAGSEAFDQILTSTVRSIDRMIFGRKAHALGAAFWPTAGETAETPEVADQIDLMNRLPKYVLTHGQADVSWANSHVITIDSIVRLKAEAKRPHALFHTDPLHRRRLLTALPTCSSTARRPARRVVASQDSAKG